MIIDAQRDLSTVRLYIDKAGVFFHNLVFVRNYAFIEIE